MSDVSDSHSSPARSEHTPGPWRVVEAGGFWVVPGVVTFDHGTPDITIVPVPLDITIVPVPLDSEANPRLIAAAPDLLTAAHGAAGYFATKKRKGTTTILADLIWAIAKVEGRA
jgi:hypothetical protein